MMKPYNPFLFIKKYAWESLLILFWVIYFAYLWSTTFQISDQGHLTVGQVNMWGDWAIHFTMGSTMAYRDLIPMTSPLMVDAPFSYPFATNLIAALLHKLGVPFYQAFLIPSFVFSIMFVFSLLIFFNVLLKNRVLAILSTLLFLFNGGVGIYYFLQDVIQADDFFNALLNPKHEYTNFDPQQIKWISVIVSMIVPQRSYAIGAGTCLFALSIIFHSFQFLSNKIQKPSIKWNLIAGVLLGFLPILHTHSFLAAFIILGFWFFADMVRVPREYLVNRFWSWMLVAGVTSVIALPIIQVFFASQVGEHFFKWYPGWYAKEFDMNWFVFWFKNWTLVPFLAFLGMFFLVKKDQGRERVHNFLIICPGILLFIVPNLFLTQPWIWDNTKLLMWSSVFLTPLAIYCLYQLFIKGGPVFKLMQRIFLWLVPLFQTNKLYAITNLPNPYLKQSDLLDHIQAKVAEDKTLPNELTDETRKSEIQEIKSDQRKDDVDEIELEGIEADKAETKENPIDFSSKDERGLPQDQQIINNEPGGFFTGTESLSDSVAMTHPLNDPKEKLSDINEVNQSETLNGLNSSYLSQKESIPGVSFSSTSVIKVEKVFSPNVLQLIAGLARRVTKLIVILIIGFMLSSGILDAYFAQRMDLHRYTMYSRQELALADWTKTNTDINSRWLTSSKHNHWLFNLTGRQAIMTYLGWLWTHGYQYQPVEVDVRKMFSSGDIDLIQQYQVNYIVVDNEARKNYGANEGLLRSKFLLVKRLGEYRIYQVPEQLLKNSESQNYLPPSNLSQNRLFTDNSKDDKHRPESSVNFEKNHSNELE